MTIRHWPRVGAIALGGLTVAFALSSLALMVLTPTGSARPINANAIPGIQDFVRALTGITFAAVGALLVWQRGNLVGWLLCLAGLSYTASYEWANRYLAYSQSVHQLPASSWVAWFGGWAWVPAFAILLTFLPLVFPTGTLVSRRWGLVAIGAAITSTALLFCAMVSPDNPQHLYPQWQNPLGTAFSSIRLSGDNQAPVTTAYLGTGGFGMVALGSLLVRYRRSSLRERRQVQWFGIAVVIVIVGWMLAWSLPQLVVGVLPVAVGIAVLRYHLYDIELAISKALVYGALAAFITVIYIATVVGLGSLIGTGGRFGLVLGILATALIAVAFQPVRERMNRLANQLVFGSPSNPYDMLSELGRSTGGADVDDVLQRIARAIAEGARSERARVRLLLPGDQSRTATWPIDAAGPFDNAYPVHHGGALIGEVEVRSVSDPAVMATLAGQAGLALRTLRLSAELADRLEQLGAQAQELAASRTRLVEAQEAERRRLERDLHDGVQQELVALITNVRLARNQLARDPELASATLSQLQLGIQRALADLREVAHGIHPAVLSSRGLVEAVEAMAARMPLGIQVDADPRLREARYAAEIEGAAYFVVAEGLTNVMKHAGADQATVRISTEESRLCVQVDDDGRGFVPGEMPESGLRGLRDRIEALGGRLIVSSRRHGTHLEATLPARERADD